MGIDLQYLSAMAVIASVAYENGINLHENTPDCFMTIPGDLWLQVKRRAPDAKIPCV